MKDDLIYLDTYVLQQDMRIRMPKSIISNLLVEKGKTKFKIFLDKTENELVLKQVSMALDGFPHEICAVNEHVFILRTYYCRFQNYLYCCLSKKEIRDMVFALASSKAAQPGLNQNEVMGIEINLPDEDILTSCRKTGGI